MYQHVSLPIKKLILVDLYKSMTKYKKKTRKTYKVQKEKKYITSFTSAFHTLRKTTTKVLSVWYMYTIN